MRRVVVTGIGLITPLGDHVKQSWENLVSAKSGIKKIERFEVSDLPSKIAGLVHESFDSSMYISSKDKRRLDDFIVYGLAAAKQAIEDSGCNLLRDKELERIGVIVGSGIGGLPRIYSNAVALYENGIKKVSPFFIPSCLINLVSGQISIKYGFKGPNHSVVTACASGTHAIGDAFRIIQFGDADIMVAGGAEAAVCRLGIAGFSAMHALSTNYNDNPTGASRPWDKNRDGFVIGEGAGIVILEELEHARKRGAKIYAEVVGYGMSGDAYHIAAPAEDGNGAYRAMLSALNNAKLSYRDVNYINAHGTSTPPGDVVEYNAVRRLFQDSNVFMSSTKSSIGHLLGAAGAVEAIFSILSMNNSLIPPTLNLYEPFDSCESIDLVPLKAKEEKINVVLSNSFGFGGTNASLVFKKFL